MIAVSSLFKRVRFIAFSLFLAGAGTVPIAAQESAKPPAPDAPAMIKITLPPETELRTLIDFVSVRLGVQILYDEQVANKKISINAPQPIPADTLVDLLKSALRMKGLALIDAEVKGWKRIVIADDLTRFAEPERKGQAVDDIPGTTAVTQTFSLTHMSPAKIKAIIDPFLSKQGANVITFPDKNLLIVTDYASNLRRISQLIVAIDQAGPERSLKFYQVEFVSAEQLSQQLTQSIASRFAPQIEGMAPVTITSDKRTNQLIIVGTSQQVDDVLRLAKAFDVALEQRTQVYSFKFVNAERIDRLIKGMFDPAMLDRLYRSSIDQEDNLLIVTGTDEIHLRIEQFKKEMDLETKRPGSGVKFYRLTYAAAEDVLNTLRSIDQRSDTGFGNNSQRGVSSLGRGGFGGSRSDGVNETPNDFVPGPNNPNQPGAPSNTPPALRQDGSNSAGEGNRTGMTGQGSGRMLGNDIGAGAIGGNRARISVDKNTNSIIVIGDRATQQTYEELIKKLDRRRPQVMIEAKVVVVDTSDNFSLGVELSGAGGTVRKLVQFTSFGLSTVSPTTGALAIIPGQGFNWTLVDPNGANAVVRALSTHSRAKVTSAPQLLVNDNATGNLASVTEVPFTSVNASNTVATTSFAGFAEAGTTIKVTPRITDDDHLELKYNVALNSFTGSGSNGVPPPRQTDEIQSVVVVPDGYTVIVGGLTRQNFNKALNSVPIVENIPIINLLAGSRTRGQSQTTLFIFLRPVILRDDKFRDLKFLSDRAFPKVDEPGNYPRPTPLLVR